MNVVSYLIFLFDPLSSLRRPLTWQVAKPEPAGKPNVLETSTGATLFALHCRVIHLHLHLHHWHPVFCSLDCNRRHIISTALRFSILCAVFSVQCGVFSPVASPSEKYVAQQPTALHHWSSMQNEDFLQLVKN